MYNLMTIYCCEFREVCDKQVIKTIIFRTAGNNIFSYQHVANKVKTKSLDCAQEAGENTRISAHDFTNTSFVLYSRTEPGKAFLACQTLLMSRHTCNF